MVGGDVVHDANLAQPGKSDVRLARQRKYHGERCAGSVVVAGRDRAVMLLHDPSRDRQAEARALVRPSRIRLVEALEDALEIVRGNAAAVLGEGQQTSRIILLQPELARPAWFGELHGMVNQDTQEADARIL